MVKVTETTLGRRVTVLITGTTMSEVEDARQRYLNAYHPYGYSTSFDPVFVNDDGTYELEGYRYDSCD